MAAASATSSAVSDGAAATSPPSAPVAAAPATCETAPAVTFFTSPASPAAGSPVRVIALSSKALSGELRVGQSDVVTSSKTRRGGPPYFWIVETTALPAGSATASFVQEACPEAKAEALRFDVLGGGRPPPASPRSGVWPARSAWTRTTEDLFSAWVEALFDAPDAELPSWKALHEVLRDRARNFLFDHLGAAEDSGPAAPLVRPDCADLPYFLRAYFAWKLRLPFGLGECSRGRRGSPPACHGLQTNEDADARADERRRSGAVATFGAFLRGTVADHVHSGSARTPFEDESSDYYPVRLSWETLRPGTVYADPYGHVLVVAKRIPGKDGGAGILYAVDGQPDGTVARKRFWRGNFLYANDPALGGPGFKRFRPLVREGGRLVRASDAQIRASAEYGDLSRDAARLDVEGFYDAMDDLLAPTPLDPVRALAANIDALDEQVRTRVSSVENGRLWLEKGRGPVAMPEGPEIFETTGPWEDFSTPSRDLRLLIALDAASSFPARVGRRPTRFAMPAGKTPADVEAELDAILRRELEARSVVYTRSDGSPFTLTLAVVASRRVAFETTYNPNDCVEHRWGAPPGSAEAATCRARAPAEQHARMEAFRPWFHQRKRPPRR